jgi:hypothetical protein
VLFALFGMPEEAIGDLPVAAVSYLGESGNRFSGYCLRADPVHLTPDRDQLVLAGPEVLALSIVEAQTLVEEINRVIAADGWRLEAQTPQRWYLHLPQSPSLRTCNLSQVRGHAISAFLPYGRDGKRWHGILNEIQMILHASPVNRERQANRKLPVSSLWFWGGGELPAPDPQQARRWAGVWSDEPLSTGLARLGGAPVHRLPANATDWLQQAGDAGEHLLVLDGLQPIWDAHDTAARRETLRMLQMEWFQPLLTALQKSGIATLNFYTCNRRRFTLTRHALWRVWRYNKKLADYC